MDYQYVQFENETARKLYHIITEDYKVKITPYPGMWITEKMMVEALTMAQKHKG